MKKTNKALFILLAIILVFSLLTLAACQPPSEEKPDDGEDKTPSVVDTAIVKNGNFANASNSDKSNFYVKDTVNNWTAASGVTSYSSVSVGVIDLTESLFNDQKGAVYDGLAYPGISPNTPKKEDNSYADTNALVISNTNTAGSLYYKSSAITLGKGKYYKLSMDVYTKILEADSTKLQGAWIYINTGAYAEFQAIDTSESWKTYTVYIEANNAADRTMYIQLWLGYGPKFIGSSQSGTPNPRMTKGVALFDNIVMTSIGSEAYGEAFAANSVRGREVTVVSDNKNKNSTAVISLVYPDTNFSYVSDLSTTASSSYKAYFSAKKGVPNTNNYTTQVGKDKIEDTADFPTSEYGYSYSTVGIFDMSKLFSPTYNEDEGKTFKEYIDSYNKINTAFVAPKIGTEYEFDAFMDPANPGKYKLAGRPDDPADSTALMIYHPNYSVSGYGYKGKNNLLIEKGKYYTISVWVYLWVPEYGKTAVTAPTAPGAEDTRPIEADKPVRADFDSDEAYNAALSAYNTKVSDWKKYDEDMAKYTAYDDALKEYNKARDRAYATFKLTGATIEGGEMLAKSEKGKLGEWQQLTFKIKGNELSDRSVALEFWYGEGNWGEDTLMAGGCFFDNISILTSSTGTGEFKTLSPLTVEDYTQFDLLNSPSDDNFVFHAFERDSKDEDWEYSFEDKKTSSEAGKAGFINGYAARNPVYWGEGAESQGYFAGYTMPDTFDVTVNDKERLFNLVMLRNDIYTSSILKYKPKTVDLDTVDDERQKMLPDLTVYPNAFYRLSMWVYTEGIDDSLGLTAALFKADDTSLTSLSKINTKGKWTEIVFYLQGSSDDFAEMYIKFTLGTGDNYTPANLVKGVVYATAITYKSIAYSEYNGAATGALVTKYEVPSSTSAQNTITNGWFNNLDNTTYNADKKDIFDEEGNLIGIGIPETWIAKSAESAIKKPTNVKIDNGVLSWTKGSDKDQGYLIYMDGIKVEAESSSDKKRTVDNYFVGDTADTSWTISSGYAQKGASFKVRAVRFEDASEVKILGFSDFSMTAQYNGDDKGTYNENFVGLHLPKSGVIDYKHYNEGGFPKDETFYTENHDNPYSETNKEGKLYYVSPYDKLLMVSSEYETKLGYLSPSTGSLTSNAYYALSVWVKTEGGAKAGITISNKSNVISINAPGGTGDLDYIGYVDVDTQGKWVQYTFYIKTTKMTSPAGLQLELYLGNKYAKPHVVGTDTYIQGASKGTVYFDDVYYKKLTDEAEYNELVYGDADPANKKDGFEPNTPAPLNRLKDINGNLLSNDYLYQLVDLTTDSFDNFAEGTSPIGGTPGSYSHYNADEATPYSASDTLAAMLYGVYDKRTVMDEVSETVLDAGAKTQAMFGNADTLQAFLTQNVGTGNNYLMLANILDNGQYYLTSDSFSLTSSAYYKISFFAKLKAAEGKKAEFRFEYGAETDKWSTVYIDSEEWTEYTFYVYNSDKSTVAGNKFAFYLGSNDKADEGESTPNFFAGILIIDNVTFAPLSGADEYNQAVTNYDALTAEGKAAANFGYHKFVEAKAEPEEPDKETPDEDENKPRVNSQLWLLVSSIVIGALLLAVVVILSWRKISKRIKRNIPVKVISNVPVNMQTKEQRKTAGNKKDNIGTDDFID